MPIAAAPRTLVAGTLLTREWAGHVQHVMVLADGFAWNGQNLRQPVGGRPRHHGHAMERAYLLRPLKGKARSGKEQD